MSHSNFELIQNKTGLCISPGEDWPLDSGATSPCYISSNGIDGIQCGKSPETACRSLEQVLKVVPMDSFHIITSKSVTIDQHMMVRLQSWQCATKSLEKLMYEWVC